MSDLVTACLQGDGSAWTELERRFGEAVSARMSAHLPGAPSGEVWDQLRRRSAELPPDAARLREFLGQIADDAAAWHLLDHHRQGDSRAFEQLRSLFSLWLRGVIRSVLPDGSAAEDVGQTVWMKVHEQPPRRPSDSRSLTPFRSWLRIVARREALRVRAKRDRQSEAPDENLGVDPPPEPSPVLREAVSLIAGFTERPHQTLAYVLNRFLDMKPEEMTEESIETPLARLVIGLPDRLAGSGKTRVIRAEDWGRLLGPLARALTGTSGGGTCLRDYLDPSRPERWSNQITQWVNATQRRLAAAMCDQEEAVLKCVFDNGSPPHRSVTFGFLRLLPFEEGAFVARSGASLQQLSGELKSEYHRRARILGGLAAGRIDICFAPLDRELVRLLSLYVREERRRKECYARGARLVGDTVLYDYYVAGDRPGRIEELRRWTAEVRQRLISCFRRNGYGLLWAHVHELL